MRENRPYGSEGGEGSTLPDPYQRPRMLHEGDAIRSPYNRRVEQVPKSCVNKGSGRGTA